MSDTEVDLDDHTRVEWTIAEAIVGDPEDWDEMVVMLAKEVLRLRQYAEVTYELLDSNSGRELYRVLEPKIGKLYMALNSRARGEDTDLDGDPVEPWNRLVELTCTAVVRWMAANKWAVLEHRNADKLRRELTNLHKLQTRRTHVHSRIPSSRNERVLSGYRDNRTRP